MRRRRACAECCPSAGGGGLGSVLQPPALGWVTWETRELLPVITLVLLPLSSNPGMEGGMEGLSRPCIGGGSAPWVGALWGTHGRATRAVPTPLKLGGESGAAGAPFGFFIVTSMILSLCFCFAPTPPHPTSPPPHHPFPFILYIYFFCLGARGAVVSQTCVITV